MLILDEILGLTDRGIVTIDELKKLIDQLGSGMELYLTGTSRCEELWPYVERGDRDEPRHTADIGQSFLRGD